jgi:tetratricopeptide (TPR) repeat protein
MMDEQDCCRGCGQNRPSDAPSGLCPACLLKAGLLGEGSVLPDVTITFGPASSSVLASFGEAFGNIPPVLLRDADSITDPGPVIRPSSPEMPDSAERSARLQLFGEIARGGMGAVFKGRDADLGRDLAVKILLESHRDKPEMIRRFVEEAQIAGQLQHPGIVPIYELGAFGERRPYFAMKLVKGRTLAGILANRKTPSDGLPRLLSIFESICQTMAYAHARGVIHRDLKPSNVMVGSFGEVQVMDWGLAKVLPCGGAVEDASAGRPKDQGTVIATARTGSDSDQSQSGSIMGTPSYMAPEQARGEVDLVNERADVFALGSIFCELLTGEPAFTGRSPGELQRKAARGELTDAFARIDQNSFHHDPELIALAKACLASERDDRPSNADEVAERMRLYHSRVQERLRQSEIARAEEKARAEEAIKRALVERDRFRLTVALAASVLGLIILGGGSGAYFAQQRAARRAATERVVSEALDEAILLRGLAKAAPIDDLTRWTEAVAAANKAHSSLDAGEPTTDLRARVVQLLATIKQEQANAAHRAREAERDRKFLERLETIRNSTGESKVYFDDIYRLKLDSDYSTAFREFGIDPDHLDPKEAGRLLRERSRPLEIAQFLDHWALNRRSEWDRKGDAAWRRLIATARATDRDPWRDDLRKLLEGGSHEAVLRLATDQGSLASQPARSLYLLAKVLEVTRDQSDYVGLKASFDVLKRAWRLSPNDYQICHELSGYRNERFRREFGKKPRFWRNVDVDERRFATAAVAANPSSAQAHASLADAFLLITVRTGAVSSSKLLRPSWGFDPEWIDAEDLNDAIAEYREAIRLDPTLAYVRRHLGNVLMFKGEIENALAEYREAARLDPKDVWVHKEAAFRLYLKGRLDAAITELLEAIRVEPLSKLNHTVLGIIYQEQGKLSQAFAAYRQALRLGDFSHPANEGSLRQALEATGKPEEVLDAYREAIRLDPKRPALHHEIGEIHSKEGRTQEANAAYDAEIALLRETVCHDRHDANARIDLGKALIARGRRNEGIAEFQAGIQLKPNDADSLNDLASYLATSPQTNRRDGKAAVEYATKACELTEWKNPDYLNTLAAAHAESGDFEAAVKWQTKAIELLTNEKGKEDYRTRLRLYRDRMSYHTASP